MKVRELKAIINERISLIKQSNRSFKDIFNCVHYQENNTFSEELDGFKIVKTTYKEAKMSSILMGHYFDTNISLPKGSYVGLMMENKKEWIFSFWGLLMAGFKPVLLNTRLGLTLNKDVVKLLDLKMIVSDQEIGLTKDEININKIKLEETDRTIDDFVWENEIALTTSATTLNIKICVYKGENITAQILNTDRIISENTLIMKHYNKELKQLAFLPFYHVFGLIATYFWFAFFSRTFVFLKDYSVDTILNTIKRHKVTHVFAVPLLWHGIHKEIIKQVKQKGKKTKKKFDRAVKFSIFIQRTFPRWGLKLARKMFKEVNNKLFGDSVYMHGGTGITITNSKIGKSGGAAIHIEDAHPEVGEIFDVHVTVDANTTINNWVNGNEAWFNAYAMSTMVAAMKSTIEGHVSGAGRSILKKEQDQLTGQMSEKMNLIILAPSVNNAFLKLEDNTTVSSAQYSIHIGQEGLDTGTQARHRTCDLNLVPTNYQDPRDPSGNAGFLYPAIATYSPPEGFLDLVTYLMSNGVPQANAGQLAMLAGFYNLTKQETLQIAGGATLESILAANPRVIPKYLEVVTKIALFPADYTYAYLELVDPS